eukprot:Ihof_evm4s717 gene=Ihof_evmTU4s717
MHEISTLQRDSQIFVANDTWYTVFRLHQLLYDRLQQIKSQVEAAQIKAPYVGADYRAGEIDTSNMMNDFMRLARRLLEGTIDQMGFEDGIRETLGVQGYIIYTLDRLVSALLRALSQAISEPNSYELHRLYMDEIHHVPDGPMAVPYVIKAGSVIRDGNRYSLSYDPRQYKLTINMIYDEGRGIETQQESDYRHYLNAYVRPGPTSSTLADVLAHGPRVFLGRTRQPVANEDSLIVANGLECRICIATCARVYVPNTSDLLFRIDRKPTKSTSQRDRMLLYLENRRNELMMAESM